MAGIGFRLRKMLDQESYLATIQAYLYSALISSGPWLITILVLGALTFMQTGSFFTFRQVAVFRLTIIYVYAFSLIVVGLVQMPLTRYLADLLFSRDFSMYLPTYIAALLLVGAIQLLIAAPAVFLFSDWSFTYASHALILYLAVSFTWVAMIFITTVKDFFSVSMAFVIGGLISLVAGYFLGQARGIEGYMAAPQYPARRHPGRFPARALPAAVDLPALLRVPAGDHAAHPAVLRAQRRRDSSHCLPGARILRVRVPGRQLPHPAGRHPGPGLQAEKSGIHHFRHAAGTLTGGSNCVLYFSAAPAC